MIVKSNKSISTINKVFELIIKKIFFLYSFQIKSLENGLINNSTKSKYSIGT